MLSCWQFHCLDDTAFTFGFGEVEDKELFGQDRQT